MSKIIGFTGPSYLFLTPNEMYGEIGKLKQCHKNYKNADIYFLTKMKHVKFNENYIDIKKNKIHIKIICAGVEEKVTLDPIEHLYKIKHLSNMFESKQELFFYILHNEYTPKNRYLNFIYSSAKKLYFNKLISKQSILLYCNLYILKKLKLLF